jgi:hypothetical protein
MRPACFVVLLLALARAAFAQCGGDLLTHAGGAPFCRVHTNVRYTTQSAWFAHICQAHSELKTCSGAMWQRYCGGANGGAPSGGEPLKALQDDLAKRQELQKREDEKRLREAERTATTAARSDQPSTRRLAESSHSQLQQLQSLDDDEPNCGALEQALARDKEAIERQGKVNESLLAELEKWSKENEEAQHEALRHAVGLLIDGVLAGFVHKFEKSLDEVESQIRTMALRGDRADRFWMERLATLRAKKDRLQSLIHSLEPLKGHGAGLIETWEKVRASAREAREIAREVVHLIGEIAEDEVVKGAIKQTGLVLAANEFEKKFWTKELFPMLDNAFDLGKAVVSYGYEADRWARSRARVMQLAGCDRMAKLVGCKDSDPAAIELSLRAVTTLKKRLECTTKRLAACRAGRPIPPCEEPTSTRLPMLAKAEAPQTQGPAESPPTAEPLCNGSVDISNYEQADAALVGGTTWKHLAGRPSHCDAECEKKFREFLARQQVLEAEAAHSSIYGQTIGRFLDALSGGSSSDPIFSPQSSEYVDSHRYRYVISMAASTSAPADLLERVLLDNVTVGEFSRKNASAYRNLKGRKFDRLDCHSNGAVLCLAALRNCDAVAREVRLFGPQINKWAATEWLQLVQKGLRLKIYINERDPVPLLSSTGILPSSPLPTTGQLKRAAWGVIMAADRARDIVGALTGMGLDAKALPCSAEEAGVMGIGIGCHSFAKYQANLGEK